MTGRTLPAHGDRVVTPDGPGQVVGRHVAETYLYGRLERRNYVIVQLDREGRRFYSPVDVTVETPES